MARLLLLAAFLVTTAAHAAPPEPPPADVYARISVNLVAALKSGNDGVQCSALQQLAAYGGDRVDARAARFEIVRLFRDHPDKRMRMMALVALTQLDDPWVTDFLTRTARYERDPRLARIYRHAALASRERTS